MFNSYSVFAYISDNVGVIELVLRLSVSQNHQHAVGRRGLVDHQSVVLRSESVDTHTEVLSQRVQPHRPLQSEIMSARQQPVRYRTRRERRLFPADEDH